VGKTEGKDMNKAVCATVSDVVHTAGKVSRAEMIVAGDVLGSVSSLAREKCRWESF
jgi:hypothetical protein